MHAFLDYPKPASDFARKAGLSPQEEESYIAILTIYSQVKHLTDQSRLTKALEKTTPAVNKAFQHFLNFMNFVEY